MNWIWVEQNSDVTALYVKQCGKGDHSEQCENRKPTSDMHINQVTLIMEQTSKVCSLAVKSEKLLKLQSRLRKIQTYVSSEAKKKLKESHLYLSDESSYPPGDGKLPKYRLTHKCDSQIHLQKRISHKYQD